jgi:hypothetical protein
MQASDFTPVELIRKFGEYFRREWRRTFSVEYQRGELRKLARLCRVPPAGSLVLCCLMMGLFVVENRTGALQCIQLYGTVPPGLDHLSSITRTAEGQAIPVWLTLFTYMFVHGSWDHVIGNTVAGWVIGNLAERRMGTLGFLLAFAAGLRLSLTNLILHSKLISLFFLQMKGGTHGPPEESMNREFPKLTRTLLLTIGIALLAGCATSNPDTSSTHAKALKTAPGSLDLSRYRIATVLPFQTSNNIDSSVGVKFALDVAIRLQSDFGPIFQEVRSQSRPLGTNDELIVTGTIRDYRPGDRFARAMLIGMGAAKFKGDLMLKDGADNRVLLSAPFDKLWAWGGFLGASKGIEDMVSESEASAAATVARAKGWQPQEASK